MDTARDVAGIPGRLVHGLGGMANAPVSDESAMSPETYANPLVGSLFNAGAAAVGSGVSAPGDALAGKIPMWDESGHTSPQAVERAFDTAAIAGGGSVAGTAGREALAPSAAAAKAAGIEVPERAAASPVATLASDTAKPGAAAAVAEHAPPFYSALERQVAEVPQETMTGKQWLSTLQNRGGVKSEELDWTGARKLLEENADKPVPKAALQDHLEQNKVQVGEVSSGPPLPWEDLSSEEQHRFLDLYRDLSPYDRAEHGDPRTFYHNYVAENPDEVQGAAKWGDYQLPGGENYREKLLTLPARRDAHGDITGHEIGGPNFKSDHWDEPNVIAHLRMNDREMQIAPTAEEQAAVDAHIAASSKLEDVRKQQQDVAKEIRQTSVPLETARIDKLRADLKAGKINASQYKQGTANYYDHPELYPLQEKLQALRAQEDEIRKGLPPLTPPKSAKALHLEEVQSDWMQNHRGERQKISKAIDEDFDGIADRMVKAGIIKKVCD